MKFYILIHYSEIILKGKNRAFFLRQLIQNIKNSLNFSSKEKIISTPAGLLLELNSFFEERKNRLAKIPGIANFLPVFKAGKDLEDLKEGLETRLEDISRAESFRVLTRRSDKNFFLTSEEINKKIGEWLVKKTGKKVDLTAPELTIFVELIPKKGFFFGFEKIDGLHGLPVGSSGRGLVLLSGGIDSPVAAFMMLRRGCQLDFIHFHSFPYLNQASQEKAKELVKLLNQYQNHSRLFLLPFGDIQKSIVLSVPPKYRIVIYRRFMFRIAEKLAKEEEINCLVTGESLGQVSSQTMENIFVIGKAVDILVLRPLIGLSKEEIIKIARKIGTYEVSIMPDEDCCQLFTPRHPATKVEEEKIKEWESKLDVDFITSESLARIEVLRL